jgi:hypothetical protein
LGLLDRFIRYNGGGLPSDHHDPGYNYTLPYPKRPGHALVMLCLWGVAGACLIADTGYELYAAWETVKDLDQLYVDLGMTDVTQEDAMHSVCDPELPEVGEVWDGVVEKSGE